MVERAHNLLPERTRFHRATVDDGRKVAHRISRPGRERAQIAAHCANAGIRVLLLDLTADIARAGLRRAQGLKPDPFFAPDAVSLMKAATAKH